MRGMNSILHAFAAQEEPLGRSLPSIVRWHRLDRRCRYLFDRRRSGPLVIVMKTAEHRKGAPTGRSRVAPEVPASTRDSPMNRMFRELYPLGKTDCKPMTK